MPIHATTAHHERLSFTKYEPVPGEIAVRCATCSKLLFTTIDFDGQVEARCRNCKQYRYWDGVRCDPQVGALAHRYWTGPSLSFERGRCGTCGMTLVFAAEFHGRITAVCRGCRQLNIFEWITVTPVVQRDPFGMSPDEFMAMMEERWLALFKEFSRRRAEVAIGLRFDVFKRDGFRCRYCGISADDGAILHADHVIPQSKGGPTTLENLATACFECNVGKSDKDLGDIRPAI